jgi:hypothetical protein
MKTENDTLRQSINEDNKIFIQESMAFNVNKEEIVRLLDEQKHSLESIYEKQIRTIESSIDRFVQTMRELTDIQRELSSPALDQLQPILIQTIENEVKKTISKSTEKFELTILSINELKHSLEQIIEKHSTTTVTTTARDDVDLLNRLFSEQKKFLIDTIERQETLWSERIKRIVHEALIEQKPTSVIDTPIVIPDQVIDHPLKVRQASSNQTDQHLFKVSIKSPEPVRLFAKLFIDGNEYPRKSHTLCQRDPIHSDQVTCYIAPPAVDGPHEVIIYAKTDTETTYRATISIRLPGANIAQSIFFPYIFPSFETYQCILIQPLQSFLKYNDHVLIHMVIPKAHRVKIRNGNDDIILNPNEYINGIVQKKVQVKGDVYVYGQWDNETDLPVCFYYVI